MAGGPRALAQAKHCAWAVERRPLEQLKAEAGVDEVVLSDEAGVLLEGLVSNFYVIADAAALAAGGAGVDSQQQQQRGGADALGGLVLLTTGAHHAALPGVTQQRVTAAAARIGLRVLLQPACAGQQGAWREAFITNW